MAQTMDISEIKRLYPDEWVLLGNPEVCYLGKPMIAGYQKTALFFNRVTPVTKRRVIASLFRYDILI